MRLDVIRHQFGEDATNSLLFVDGIFECYGLEDEVRDKKVMHETAIPKGEYEIKFRTVGGFHTREKARYDKKFGAGWHAGMLELQDVPGFQFILIHTGNSDENSSGCYLLGSTQQDLDLSKDGFIGSSRLAYESFYPKVRDALLNGEKVTMRIQNINEVSLGCGDDNKISNASPPEMVNAQTINEKLSEINGNIIDLTAKMEGKNII